MAANLRVASGEIRDVGPMTDAPKPSVRAEIAKDRVVEALSGEGSGYQKYHRFFVGDGGMGAFLQYELAMLFASATPGALGYALRKTLYPSLFGHIGSRVNFGRNLSLRCPSRMTIGDDVAIDDGCALDARGAADASDFVIGDGTLVARDTVMVVKQGYLRIGANCSIGSQCSFAAVSGIEIGDHAIVAGQSYFGGGRYKTALGAGPMVVQGLETKGPVVLGDDVWVGAGVRVLDGVTVGDGAILGAGSVVTANAPPGAIMAGIPARQIGERR